MTVHKFCSSSYYRQNTYIRKTNSLFILKFCFDTSEISFMLLACRIQNPSYVWVPWSILVGHKSWYISYSCSIPVGRKNHWYVSVPCSTSVGHKKRWCVSHFACLSDITIQLHVSVLCSIRAEHINRSYVCFTIHTFRITKRWMSQYGSDKMFCN